MACRLFGAKPLSKPMLGYSLSIGPLSTHFSEILIKIQTFSVTKMHMKMSSAKWLPFCPEEDELNPDWMGVGISMKLLNNIEVRLATHLSLAMTLTFCCKYCRRFSISFSWAFLLFDFTDWQRPSGDCTSKMSQLKGFYAIGCPDIVLASHA